jgi:DMSO reductase anchor subunit
VQACPNEAITIGVIKTAGVEPRRPVIPGAIGSGYTRPTTVYKGAEKLAAAFQPSDHARLHPEHVHLPLVLMLTMTQAGLGLVAADAFLRLGPLAGGLSHLLVAALGALLCFAGLAASVLHLGRPLGAWRAFLGWRKSWLSREIIAFGPWSGLVGASTGLAAFEFVPALRPATGWLPADLAALLPVAVKALPAATLALGAAAVFCSVMVYVDTRREFWKLPATLGRFFGNTLVLAAGGITAAGVTAALPVFAVLLLGKLALEASTLLHAREPAWTARKKSALLQLGPLRKLVSARFALGLLALGLVATGNAVFTALGIAALLAGEFAERAIYFQAVVAHKMPGDVYAE